MVARAGEAFVFLQAGSQGNRTRATMKALPTAPHRPRPYGSPGLLPDFPTEVDAYWVQVHSAPNIEYIYRQNSWYKSFSIVPYWSPLSLEIEMREIFGKMCPISREIFFGNG